MTREDCIVCRRLPFGSAALLLPWLQQTVKLSAGQLRGWSVARGSQCIGMLDNRGLCVLKISPNKRDTSVPQYSRRSRYWSSFCRGYDQSFVRCSFMLRLSLSTNYKKLIVAQLATKFPAFIEPEGSLPCSQECATRPYDEWSTWIRFTLVLTVSSRSI
jgi:hypothetical protein